MLTGPGAATVTALGPSEITGRVARPGSYLLRVHFTPYWSVARGSVCVARASGAMTRLDVAHAGLFALRADETPARVLRAIFDRDRPHCEAPTGASGGR
jgi:hypothetical protein